MASSREWLFIFVVSILLFLYLSVNVLLFLGIMFYYFLCLFCLNYFNKQDPYKECQDQRQWKEKKKGDKTTSPSEDSRVGGRATNG